MTITSAQAAIDDVIDRIRSEAMIADRPGQLARLNAIADHLAELAPALLAAYPATAPDREEFKRALLTSPIYSDENASDDALYDHLLASGVIKQR